VPFDRNVFVNCPFDEGYRSLLRPLLFTIYYLGFQPRIALETVDSGKPRIDKIVSLIERSKYAIHDISRIRATKAREYFRLNMPFELGIDVGCRLFHPGPSRRKKCLILEAEKYRYQAAISDLSGSDIAVHSNKPENVAKQVRNWLNANAPERVVSPSQVWAAFNEFMSDNDADLTRNGFSRRDIKELAIDELMACMSQWVKKRCRVRSARQL